MSASTLIKRRAAALAFATCAIALCLTACAPQGEGAVAVEPDEAGITPAEFSWSQDGDCAVCHETNAKSFDDSSCAASRHASLKSDCLTCHDDVPGLEDAHKKVTFESEKKKATLKKTEVGEDICLTCHDKAELAVATEASAALADKNGLTVNPHDLPATNGHAEAGITCSSCHKLHTSEGPKEIASAVCLNCHHADVYECNTCHVEK